MIRKYWEEAWQHLFPDMRLFPYEGFLRGLLLGGLPIFAYAKGAILLEWISSGL